MKEAAIFLMFSFCSDVSVYNKTSLALRRFILYLNVFARCTQKTGLTTIFFRAEYTTFWIFQKELEILRKRQEMLYGFGEM